MTRLEYERILKFCWERDFKVDVEPLTPGYKNKSYYLFADFNGKRSQLKDKQTGEIVYNKKTLEARRKEAYINAYKFLKDDKAK